VGLNECLRNLNGYDLTTDEGVEFGRSILQFMANKVHEFQKETVHYFNLEASPAESCGSRMAACDKRLYPDIITAGEGDVPYYTNSSHLPVGYTDDLFEALRLQEPLQVIYNSGTVFHTFLGESIDDPKLVGKLLRRICENYKVPYIDLTPSFTICPEHGYVKGAHAKCPICR
jgi:ribonucleoside-triphosphate reductase